MRLSGHYGGPISRLLGFIIDNWLVGLTYAAIAAALSYLIGLVSTAEVGPNQDSGNAAWGIGLIVWWVVYGVVSLAVVGRTPGMWVLGLKVVQRDGAPLKLRAAFIRVITFPVSMLTLGLGFVGLIWGRERRALHDIFARTTMVYDWGDRPAELPGPLTNYLDKRRGLPVEELEQPGA
jgi:uncharacterized RDD family membrane protein YckC